VLQGGCHYRAHGVVRELPRPRGIDRAAVDTDADGAVVLGGDVHQVGHFVPDRFLALVVVQVPGVVSDLVDVGSDLLRESIALLQIHRQVGLGSLPDLGDRLGLLVAVDGDAHDAGAGLPELLRLIRRRLHVDRLRGAHALHHHGVGGAEGYAPDSDGARRVSSRGHGL
jgi:hypothetical protein